LVGTSRRDVRAAFSGAIPTFSILKRPPSVIRPTWVETCAVPQGGIRAVPPGGSAIPIHSLTPKLALALICPIRPCRPCFVHPPSVTALRFATLLLCDFSLNPTVPNRKS
jgi:hypothetical protein